MNVFWLADDPVDAARYHDDERVIKMVTEGAQLLATALHIRDVDPLSDFRLEPDERESLYAPFNYHNSLPHWCALSRTHALRVFSLVGSLNREYQKRWDTDENHGAWESVWDWRGAFSRLPDHGWERPPFYGPEEYEGEDIVASYRRYYAHEKGASAVYARAPVPEWWPESAPQPATEV